MAGRLKHYYEKWKVFTQDKRILSWVKGIKIPFLKRPKQLFIPKQQNFSASESGIIKKAVNKLLKLGAISRVQPCKDQFISHIFTIPKPDGSARLILNLKSLNHFIKNEHFKLEDQKVVSNIITPGCFMSKLDLKDAYLLIPIRKQDRRYLRFYFQDMVFQYNCLCFGINFAPMLFTKLIKPIMYVLRSKGHLSVVYLDDFLLLGHSYKDCLENVKETITILESLGFLINYNKSFLEPQQKCSYLGFEYNSVDMTIAIPDTKKQNLSHLLASFANKKVCSIRMFARMLGKLISVCPAVDYGYLYTKMFEREKYLALLRHRGNFNAKMKIPSSLRDDFQWWLEKLKNNSKSLLKKNKFIQEIFSDASLIGWGAHCGNINAQGIWSEQEKNHYISYLELLAVYFGLKCFAKELSDCSILCRVDNNTAIAYINRMGSVQFQKLNALSRTIWQWCEKKNIHIFASYIKSVDNREADNASRNFQIDTEWSLNESAFKKLVERLGDPR